MSDHESSSSSQPDPSPLEKYPEVADWLRQRGHTDREIDKILERVERYEQETEVDSVMDSIERGSFNIGAIIRDALAELDESDDPT